MVFGDDEVPTKYIKHKNLRMENTVLENKRIDILGLESLDKIYDPFFKKLTTARIYSKNSNYMVFPIYSLNEPDSLLISVQVLAKMRGGKFQAGFTLMDEMFMCLICNMFAIKVHQVLSTREMNKTRKDVVNTIDMASYMSTQRSYADFIKVCRDKLAKYLGFEAVGVLFRDTKEDFLFQIMLQDGEGAHDAIWKRKKKGDT